VLYEGRLKGRPFVFLNQTPKQDAIIPRIPIHVILTEVTASRSEAITLSKDPDCRRERPARAGSLRSCLHERGRSRLHQPRRDRSG
jgi:hypothetical protein